MLHQLIILVGDFRTDIIILHHVFILVRGSCTGKNNTLSVDYSSFSFRTGINNTASCVHFG
jgi:hypothetical protein